MDIGRQSLAWHLAERSADVSADDQEAARGGFPEECLPEVDLGDLVSRIGSASDAEGHGHAVRFEIGGVFQGDLHTSGSAGDNAGDDTLHPDCVRPSVVGQARLPLATLDACIPPIDKMLSMRRLGLPS